jgi:UDP:flavonoid glycosyltransferase YjiC (YdhE family)
MRITVVAMSGRGDTEPFLALAVRLQGSGHQVRLAGRPDFAELVSAHGVEFAPVGNPYQPFIAGAAAANAVGSGRPLQKAVYGIRQRRYVTDSVHDDTLRSCRDADAVIFKYPLITAQSVADSLAIPCVGVMLLPFLSTRYFPSFIMGGGIDRGRIVNQLVWKLPWQFIWQGIRLDDRKLRRQLRLTPLPILAPAPFRQLPDAPVLCAWSPAVLPIPADWPPGVHATGYWFLDPAPRWQPPDDLLRFLHAGPPPVSIGFGSMVPGDRDATLTLVLDALALARQRGVLLGGWGGLAERATSLPPDVYPAATLPHSWLVPRTAAVVHHGGAGTTSAALRAGVPAVITPFLADQPSWARTVRALGAGPEPIPFPDLTAQRLARAIGEAVESPTIRARAAALGRQLQAEDGLSRATELLHQYIDRHSDRQLRPRHRTDQPNK